MTPSVGLSTNEYARQIYHQMIHPEKYTSMMCPNEKSTRENTIERYINDATKTDSEEGSEILNERGSSIKKGLFSGNLRKRISEGYDIALKAVKYADLERVSSDPYDIRHFDFYTNEELHMLDALTKEQMSRIKDAFTKAIGEKTNDNSPPSIDEILKKKEAWENLTKKS